MDKDDQQFSLSLENVKGIPFDQYEKNFTFIVNNRRYETSRYIADILSPIIREYHYIDSTIDYFTITTKSTLEDANNENDFFSDFLQLVEFTPKNVEKSQRDRYIEYSLQLGNIEEYIHLQTKYYEDLNPKNIIGRLLFIINNIKHINNIKNSTSKKSEKLKDEYYYGQYVEGMIKYASSHFYEIEKNEMKKVPFDVLDEILNEDTLKLEDEDSLLKLINELYSNDERYCVLYSHVMFTEVGDETLSAFVDLFNIEDLNSNIWSKICQKLFANKKQQTNNERYAGSIKSFERKEGDEFNGIMRYLSNETGGNIHDNGTIKISSNVIYNDDNSYHPKNLVDYQNKNYYESKNNVQNAFILFDFKDKSIQVSNYSIKSMNDSKNGEHLKSWVIEVSNDENDEKSWVSIDEHSNDPTMNGPNIISTFSTKESDTFYRFVRLRQTDKIWCNCYYFRFYFLEFYGKLKEPAKTTK